MSGPDLEKWMEATGRTNEMFANELDKSVVTVKTLRRLASLDRVYLYAISHLGCWQARQELVDIRAAREEGRVTE